MTNLRIEAVAALLYNLIYDQDPGCGWTPTSSEPDPAYRNVFLCFAEALLQVLETADPEASDAEIVQKAVQKVDRQKAGYAWETIAMDVELVSLPKGAEEHIYAVRDFLEQPYMSAEGEFLSEDGITETFETTDHHCILNAGGLMLINSEQLYEEMDSDDIARHDEVLLLSPDEALHIAALVERNRVYLEGRKQELDAYFTEVAQAWLDEFADTAKALCERGKYWWPEVRNEARHTLIRLTNAKTNPVVTSWYEQTYQEEHFPHSQQEELLTRYFKRLYYERYPVPTVQEEVDG